MFHLKLKKMKPQFFDIEDLKTKPLLVWSNQLSHTSEGFSGNIYFVADRKYRVLFDCVLGAFYEAKFYYFGSRSHFNSRCAASFRGLIDKVYEFLND